MDKKTNKKGNMGEGNIWLYIYRGHNRNRKGKKEKKKKDSAEHVASPTHGHLHQETVRVGHGPK